MGLFDSHCDFLFKTNFGYTEMIKNSQLDCNSNKILESLMFYHGLEFSWNL